MVIIFASRFDREAQSLADRWSAYDATLLTAEHLSVAGWRYYSEGTENATAVIGGRTVSPQEIRGVLTRWPTVYKSEITHVSTDDRAFVSAEITAFLRCWLTHLNCPVLNRPTATTLFGPAWRPERWVHEAAQLGIPVRPVHRRTDAQPDSSQSATQPQSTVVTVVGDHSFGDVALALKQHARRLATAAGVDLLAVHFDGSEHGAVLLSADLLPDLSKSEVVDAVLAYLLRDQPDSSNVPEDR